MHNPQGKKIGYAAAADFFTKPVAAEFPVFLNSDKIPSVSLNHKVPVNNG